MKASTATLSLLLCAAGLAASATVQAQAASGTYTRDLYGDWKVTYPAPARESSAQVRDDLARAKASGMYSSNEEDYPPMAASAPMETRAQVEQELQQAQIAGQMASDEEDYPPPMMAHSGTSAIH